MEETPGERSTRRIGVYDFNSLHNLLLESFERLYPDVHIEPAGMIQLMEAEIMHWRRTGKPPADLSGLRSAGNAGKG